VGIGRIRHQENIESRLEGFFLAGRSRSLLFPPFHPKPILAMPREHIILECTEARAEGKPVSRYNSSRDKKQQQGRVEKKKYNPHLRRHTLHREIK
jgi:large subunit ribosomal protein L33